MYYAIRHTTRFRYSAPVNESVMEVRMQPRGDAGQRCLSFRLQTSPRARVLRYGDYLGNMVHHFDVPGRHAALTITAESLVEVAAPRPLPEELGPGGWDSLDALVASDNEAWDMLQPSRFAHQSEALGQLAAELGIGRGADLLGTLRALNSSLSQAIAYVPQSTRVDSPIDEALSSRRGVCQDFAHIMISLVRGLGVPCRYVSGYLFHGVEDRDRSEADATHAWVEALVPGYGWVGFDPTNNLIVGDRHVRTAVGRDYDDVPPTRGVYKGGAASELHVSVRVSPSVAPPAEAPAAVADDPATWRAADPGEADEVQQQQQQQ